MKRVLFLALIGILLFTNVSTGRAQDGLINPDQIANTIPTVIQAGESLTAGELCKIINAGGFKAYKYISKIISSPTYLLTGGTANTYISATRMTDTTAIIAFQDNGDSNKGKSIVYNMPPTYTYLLPAISNNAVTSGNTGTFSILKPYTKITNSGFAFTGAQPYFISASNTWTTTPSNYYVGYALDTTSIMIDGAYYTNAINQTVGNSTLPVSLIRK